ncbi:MAG: 1,4-dihydroxy-2-naphthoate polyprenyltransferase [Streptomycetaceae bacterium]|nr:MAG: 1,4-dihydroxy-2-naphthoate polyprenyltransferase [Streptomycetaceae bacterium]
MSSLTTWITGARPRTLPAAIAPVLVATALAQSNANILRALLALLVSLALQIAVNYSNDYSDGVRGTDADRIGPTRLVASGLASAGAVKKAAIYSFLVAAIAGLILAWLTSWWLLLIGAAAVIAAWTYTGGKKPYGYSGLGEISVFVFFGLVATVGSYYVQTEKITLHSFIVAIPMGSLSCAILAANNIRDRAKDEMVGKRTLAVRLGDRRSRILFFTLLLSAHVAPLFTLSPWSLLTLLALPASIGLGRLVLSGISGKALIPVLAKTGQLQLAFSALLATSLWLS